MFVRISLLVVLTAGLVSVASAQRGGGGGRGGDEDLGRGFNTPTGESRLDRIGDMLRLNREQKKNVQQICDAAQKEAAPLREQIDASRVKVAAAMVDQKSQADIDQLLASHGALLAQMTGVELRAFTQIVGTLKEGQKKNLAPLLLMMTGMFNGRNWNTTVR
jgi:Heavy-metal resistance